MYKLVQGDCLEKMKQIPNNSVDVSFTSPPYCDTGTKNQDVSNNKTKHKKYLTVERTSDWFEWQCECIDEMLRVSKKWVIYNVQGLSKNRANVFKLIGKYADRIHDIIIWHKPNGCPTSTKHAISNTYEYILLLKCDGVKRIPANSDFYRNVIYMPVNANKEFNKIHRAVMSKNLCDEIIREFTSEGDLVLDPFSGLGTTGVSCIEQNRNYLGIELCEDYINASRERLDATRRLEQ